MYPHVCGTHGCLHDDPSCSPVNGLSVKPGPSTVWFTEKQEQPHFIEAYPNVSRAGITLNKSQITRSEEESGSDCCVLPQIGSYFGSELLSMDIDGDGQTDILLVAAPMYYSQGWERGKVYIYSVTPQVHTHCHENLFFLLSKLFTSAKVRETEN